MLGAGFLRQMAETAKYNRDLLGKIKRKPFENSDRPGGDGTTKLTHERSLTEAEKRELLHKMSLQAQRERRNQLWTLILALIATAFSVFLVKAVYL